MTENKKVHINTANADEISSLPGINIVIAKRIVGYRNLNGLFKSKEDFFKISGLKDHFKEKIFGMILLENVHNSSINTETERIVD